MAGRPVDRSRISIKTTLLHLTRHQGAALPDCTRCYVWGKQLKTSIQHAPIFRQPSIPIAENTCRPQDRGKAHHLLLDRAEGIHSPFQMNARAVSHCCGYIPQASFPTTVSGWHFFFFHFTPAESELTFHPQYFQPS